MDEPTNRARRLVYGPGPDGDESSGAVVDAQVAEEFGSVAGATTLGEYVASAPEWKGLTWDDYVDDCVLDGNPIPSPDDPFDAYEWLLGYSGDTPQDFGWMVLHRVLERLVKEHPEALGQIGSGGGSPGGNINSIGGSIEQLDLLAKLVDPEVDGVILERDDKIMHKAFPPTLYGEW